MFLTFYLLFYFLSIYYLFLLFIYLLLFFYFSFFFYFLFYVLFVLLFIFYNFLLFTFCFFYFLFLLLYFLIPPSFPPSLLSSFRLSFLPSVTSLRCCYFTFNKVAMCRPLGKQHFAVTPLCCPPGEQQAERLFPPAAPEGSIALCCSAVVGAALHCSLLQC